jgi:hypothetical protein
MEMNDNFESRLRGYKIGKGRKAKYTAFDLYKVITEHKRRKDHDIFISIMWHDHTYASIDLLLDPKNFYILYAAVELACYKYPKEAHRLCELYEQLDAQNKSKIF